MKIQIEMLQTVDIFAEQYLEKGAIYTVEYQRFMSYGILIFNFINSNKEKSLEPWEFRIVGFIDDPIKLKEAAEKVVNIFNDHPSAYKQMNLDQAIVELRELIEDFNCSGCRCEAT